MVSTTKLATIMNVISADLTPYENLVQQKESDRW